MNLFETLKERNLIYQTTDEKALKEMLNGSPITIYHGVDPTADSLHVGHCVPYGVLRRMQKAGHHIVFLVGGATASIGDPTGKSEMRKLLSREQINKNIEGIKKCLSVFLDFEGDNPVRIVNNADWFDKLTYVDFMREIGVHFNVNKMVTNEIYAKRIEEGGLSFFEMGYMPMQAYDFVHLNKEYGCTLQWGGADQWGNIVAGVELARKINFLNGNENAPQLVGATNPLLVTPEGKKMGKTEKGAIWIDKDKISAYDFYQGIYQTPDNCVEMMFAMFTDIPMDEVRNMIATDIVSAKKRLAYEFTKFVRGEQDANEAQNMTNNLFASSVMDKDNAPTVELEITGESVGVLDLLLNANFVASKGEARRLIEQNGLSMEGETITDPYLQVSASALKEGLLFKKGKKNFLCIKTK